MLGIIVSSLAFIVSGVEASPPSIESQLSDPILSEGQSRLELESIVLNHLPALEVPESAEDWTNTADKIREEVLDEAVLKNVPDEWLDTPLNIEWVDTIDAHADYRIRKLRYEAVPGLWIPALLYEPTKKQGAMPGVLNVNGHVGEEGKAVDYKQLRCINLAKRGIVNLSPEWYRMGELKGTVYGHDRIAYMDLAGISGLSVFYLAMSRGLDVLEEHEQVDPERLAVTGLSGGGWQTILISSLDERVALAAPNAGYIGTPTRLQYTSDIGDLEQVPTDLFSVADYTHLTAIRAPKPTLQIYNEEDNCCFKSYRAQSSIHDPIRPFYELYNAENHFIYFTNIEPGTHNYELDNREQFYAFLNKNFELNTSDTEIPSQEEILPRTLLDVGVPGDNETIISLSIQLAENIERDSIPRHNRKKFKRWVNRTREELREVLRIDDEEPPIVQPAQLSVSKIDTVSVARYKLRVGEWTVPAVHLQPLDKTSNTLTIVAADAGRMSQTETVTRLLANGHHVLALDPVYIGEAQFHERSNGQFAMFYHSVGKRLLGSHAQQLGAISDWAHHSLGMQNVHIEARGIRMSMAAITSAAVYPGVFDTVVAQDLPESLTDLIHNDVGYSRHESLFCFGLLDIVDIPELLALGE